MGTCSNGINAFFVRNDLAGGILSLMGPPRAFASRHRDSRDAEGKLLYTGGPARLDLIADMPVFDVVTGETVLIRDMGPAYSQDWLDQMAG